MEWPVLVFSNVLLLLLPLSFIQTTEQQQTASSSNCEESEKFKEHYFTIFENNQSLDLHNNKVFIQFHFKHPSVIRGWNIKGRLGALHGPMDNRSGLILKYVVKYGTRDGLWVPIENPKTRRDVFMNRGNLASADMVTEILLKQTIKTKVLRFLPEMWDGSPFMSVRVRYCVSNNDKNSTDWLDMQHERKVILKKISELGKEEDEYENDADYDEDAVKHDDESDEDEVENDDESDEDKVKNHKSDGDKVKNHDKSDEVENDDDELDEDEVENDDDESDDDEEVNSSPPTNKSSRKRKSKKNEATESQECETSTIWRYNGDREIRDTFTALFDSSLASKAEYNQLEEPYLFPSKSRKQYIQIKLAARSRISSIKIVGKDEEGDWGGINQFSLFYQDTTGKWKYYTDAKGKRRIFDTKSRDKESVLVPEEFKLPRSMDAKILRLYPHEWTGKPYISIDLKACYLDDPLPNFKECSFSLLSRDGSMLAINFNNLGKSKELNNYETHKTLKLENVDGIATVTGINIRLFTDNVKKRDAIKSFVMQYLDQNLKWKNIVDDDGVVKVFDAHSKLTNVPRTIKFPDPVETGFLRIFPESWTGENPRIFVDILGCSDNE